MEQSKKALREDKKITKAIKKEIMDKVKSRKEEEE